MSNIPPLSPTVAWTQEMMQFDIDLGYVPDAEGWREMKSYTEINTSSNEKKTPDEEEETKKEIS